LKHPRRWSARTSNSDALAVLSKDLDAKQPSGYRPLKVAMVFFQPGAGRY